MKFHKFCAGMLALLAAGVVWSASDFSNQEKLAQKYEAVVDEKAAAARTMLPAEVQPQAPAPKPQQRQALTPQQWSKTLAGMPQAEVFQGFSVHSKHFCSSCHGKQGLADTPNWPDVAGQPSAVTIKALLDYREGRRKGTPAADLMTAAVAKLSDQEIVDVAALYEYLPGRGSDRQAAPLASAPKLVLKGDPARMVTPCAACHGTSARGNPNGQVPVLHGQQDSAIETALRDYRSGARTSDMLMEMRQFSKALTDEEIKELARWYAGQPGRPAQEQK